MIVEYKREDVRRPPTHLDVIFAKDVLPNLRAQNRTVSEIARLLDVRRPHLYKVMAGDMLINPDMDARIGKLVGNGAGIWLRCRRGMTLGKRNTALRRNSLVSRLRRAMFRATTIGYTEDF